jgi:hypothetical protein
MEMVSAVIEGGMCKGGSHQAEGRTYSAGEIQVQILRIMIIPNYLPNYPPAKPNNPAQTLQSKI